MKLLLRVLALVAVVTAKTIPEQKENLSKSERSYDNSLLADNEDAKLTVPELIEKYDYPVEVHEVTTEDGYILTVHRIPYGKKCGPAPGKRVVWLQHGLLCDSSNWVVAGPENGLAYNLADQCYDVWMGNFRGNTYSKKHVTLDPAVDKKEFWTYSWNEIGYYDVPAFIDYAINVTGVDGVYYIGHSMGTTGFFVCMSERPEYNSKIKLMSAFAPVSYTEHMISPIALIAPFDGQIEWIHSMLGEYEFMPSSKLGEFLGETICHQTSPIQSVCSNVLFLIGGYDVDQLDPELVPTIIGHTPSGASVRSLVHYSQGVKSGKFRKYDHGRRGNLEVYGTPQPPEYDVEKITAPIAFYWGQNDWLGVRSDVYHLAERIPNLQRIYRVNHDRFNHFDFLWAKDNLELINRQTIDFMNKF